MNTGWWADAHNVHCAETSPNVLCFAQPQTSNRFLTKQTVFCVWLSDTYTKICVWICSCAGVFIWLTESCATLQKGLHQNAVPANLSGRTMVKETALYPATCKRFWTVQQGESRLTKFTMTKRETFPCSLLGCTINFSKTEFVCQKPKHLCPEEIHLLSTFPQCATEKISLIPLTNETQKLIDVFFDDE